MWGVTQRSLLLIIFSIPVYSTGQEGSGNAPESTTVDDTNYKLVCTATTDSTQQGSNQYCVLVSVASNN